MINGKTYVTVSSDASCETHPDIHNQKNPRMIGTGYAYYIRDDNGVTTHAWRDDTLMSSGEAEVHAAIAALMAIQDNDYPKNTKLIYYCDNMSVINILNGKPNDAAVKKHADSTRLINMLLSKFTEVEARHVPAHTKRKDMKRFYMNDWCDLNSRAMRKYNKLFENLHGKQRKAARG